MEEKKGPGEYFFAIAQMFTQVSDLAEMSVKGIASNDSVNTVLTVLQPP